MIFLFTKDHSYSLIQIVASFSYGIVVGTYYSYESIESTVVASLHSACKNDKYHLDMYFYKNKIFVKSVKRYMEIRQRYESMPISWHFFLDTEVDLCLLAFVLIGLK